MKKMTVLGFIIILTFFLPGTIGADELVTDIKQVAHDTDHNWVEYSTNYKIIDVGTHEYSYWKNLIRHTRTCHISHKIKTVVYYCADHDHTKAETELVEIIHSGNHN